MSLCDFPQNVCTKEYDFVCCRFHILKMVSVSFVYAARFFDKPEKLRNNQLTIIYLFKFVQLLIM